MQLIRDLIVSESEQQTRYGGPARDFIAPGYVKFDGKCKVCRRPVRFATEEHVCMRCDLTEKPNN